MEPTAGAPPIAPARRPSRNPVRRLYDWVLHWAYTPYGTPALGVLAFSESSFFPVPPDVLQIALSVGQPRRSLFYAAVSSAASVAGGAAGYAIGFFAWQAVSGLFFRHLSGMGFTPEAFEAVRRAYAENAFWAVFTAGFTPIPYKVFTIAAGVCEIHLSLFLAASLLSRSARFFLIGALILRFGPQVRFFIDRYFNLLSFLLVGLALLGFLALRWLG